MMPLSYRSPKTEVRASQIHGRGLFATMGIAKDETVAVKGGHIVDRKTLRERITPRLGRWKFRSARICSSLPRRTKNGSCRCC